MKRCKTNIRFLKLYLILTMRLQAMMQNKRKDSTNIIHPLIMSEIDNEIQCRMITLFLYQIENIIRLKI